MHTRTTCNWIVYLPIDILLTHDRIGSIDFQLHWSCDHRFAIFSLKFSCRYRLRCRSEWLKSIGTYNYNVFSIEVDFNYLMWVCFFRSLFLTLSSCCRSVLADENVFSQFNVDEIVDRSNEIIVQLSETVSFFYRRWLSEFHRMAFNRSSIWRRFDVFLTIWLYFIDISRRYSSCSPRFCCGNLFIRTPTLRAERKNTIQFDFDFVFLLSFNVYWAL